MKKLIFIAAILACFPTYAHAGLFELIVTVGLAVVGGPVGWSIAAKVALGVSLYAYGQYQQDQLKKAQEEQYRKQVDAYNGSLKDRTVTAVSSDAPEMYVYGQARVGSAVVAIFSSGARDEYQHLICVHAAHECQSIDEIYIAGKALGTLNGDGFAINSPDYSYTEQKIQNNTGTSWTIDDPDFVPASVGVFDSFFGVLPVPFTLVGNTITVSDTETYRTKYNVTKSRVRVKKHLGSAGDPADPTLISEVPSKWDSTKLLTGYCYTYVRLDLNQQEFQGGLPAIEVLVKGKKILDPRTSTTAWSDNPALCIYDYLRSPFCSVASADINTTYVNTAADVCDELISVGDIVNGKRYTFNGTISSGQDTAQNLNQMTQAMAGGLNSTTWDMWAGKYVAPILTLNQDDIVGDISITPGPSDADIFNGVQARYIGPENSYVPTDAIPYQNVTYRTSDGRDLYASLEYPFTDSTQRIHNLARIFIEDQRNGLTVKGVFSLKAWDTRIFDRVSLNSSFFGFTNKVFRIVGKSYSHRGTVELTLKEDAAEIWDLADAVVIDATPNSGLPNPFQIEAPTSLTLASGTNQLLIQSDGTIVTRVYATWPASVSIFANQAEIQYKLLSDSIWQSGGIVDAESGEHYIQNLKDGFVYDFRIRFLNPYFTATSIWIYADPHLVIGKTAAPETVASGSAAVENQQLVLTWSAVTDLDLAYYEVRTSDSGWNDANYLYRGQARKAVVIPPASGNTSTWYVRAIDTSGNPSAASLSIGYTTPVPADILGITETFADTSLTNATITLDWLDVSPLFGLSAYQVSYGSVVKTVKASTITLPADWIGVRSFTVKVIDLYGNMSAGFSKNVQKFAPDPVTNFRGQVIDNNALLSWTLPTKTTLPIQYVLIKRGDVFGTAEEVGQIAGSFTTISELQGGSYTYWAVVVDTDNNESTEVSLSITIGEPPDFVFTGTFDSSFNGMLTNAYKAANGTVLMPINTTETWNNHFSTRSWTNTNDQVTAGYPVAAEPSVTTSSYVETFDLGTVIGSSSVTLSWIGETIDGTVTVTPKISLSDDNVTFVDYDGQSQVFGLNFRYIKPQLTVTATGDMNVYRLTQINVSVATKKITDEGMVSCLAADTNGTIFNFNRDFIDVQSITTGVNGTTSSRAVYDHLDTVLSGTYSVTSNVVTVNVTGHELIVGQKVKLMPSTGTMETVSVIVATTPSANQFTASLTTANTSGNLQIYHQSLLAYRFSSAGAREDGVVSFTIRGV